jgi:hypothetical protein
MCNILSASVTSAKQLLLSASEDLEALRPQFSMCIGGDCPEDEPIRQSWILALDRFRAACAAYVDAG